MNDRRYIFGIVVSLVWLAFMAWVFLCNPANTDSLKPNELGDFFAGFFAPLAFLWLVLGYMQQGHELKLSTEALKLQAEELRNSVLQQKQLVDVTREQVENDRESLRLERLARREAAKPQFVIHNGGASFSGTGSAHYNLTVANAGNTATCVVGSLDYPTGASPLFNVPMSARNYQFGVGVDVAVPFPESGATLIIEFFDADGQPGKALFRVTKQNDQTNSMLTFEPLDG
jgi:hypothetical protein